MPRVACYRQPRRYASDRARRKWLQEIKQCVMPTTRAGAESRVHSCQAVVDGRDHVCAPLQHVSRCSSSGSGGSSVRFYFVGSGWSLAS